MSFVKKIDQGEFKGMYKRILLPLDGSALAEQALPHAISQAKWFQAELFLLRILAPLPRPVMVTESAVRSAEEETAEFARGYLEELASSVEERGVQVHIIITTGRPHIKILEYAETHDIDLIVMSTRGQSGFSRWLMGSVADRVVRGANVPVLLVRAVKRTGPEDEELA